MSRKIWRIKELNPGIKLLAEKYGISAFLAQILVNRNIKEEDFGSFLNPTSDNFHSPYLLGDIENAAERIKQAITKKEKVLVFGDYDVDGITSLAIFHEYSREFPGIFSFYIPHRVKEGYGLSKNIITKAKEEGVGLIIAFDCGTNAFEEITLARLFKIDIIVVDHHCPKGEPLNALAFINPKRKDSLYPFSDLSAAALSFKLLQVLTGLSCYDVLDLVALSLVCDVVTLSGENRALLSEGLKVIKETKRPAIKALCKVGSIRQENIDTFHIGYILGPRINASGRVAHADDALELFLAKDEAKACDFASKLGEYNVLRKDIEGQILREAEQRINDNVSGDYAIVVSGEGWHLGVLGIVASRLADKYCRPSFVISFDEGLGRGSARSYQSVHLLNILDKCADSLLMYGGHSKAAGMHISKEDLDGFKEKINSFLEENTRPQDFIPAVEIDAVLGFEDINMAFVEELQKLRPYGEWNPVPFFAAYNITKRSPLKKINSYHSVWLDNGRTTLEGIIYDSEVLEIATYADKLDIVFSLEKNRYHNSPRLIIRDCGLSK